MQITIMRGISRRIAHVAAALRRYVPSQCAVCRAWPEARICADCVARFAVQRHRCMTCAMPIAPGIAQCGECVLRPPALDRCVAVLDYAYPWAGVIAQFKFTADPGWSAPLARLMLQGPSARQLLADADLVLPIALSRERLGERGFNQALLLARHLAPPHALHARLLVRTRHAPPQRGLARKERLRNLRSAFLVDPRQQPLVVGKNVLLIDDVMTTGATLQSAAHALRAAGAGAVRALVLARTQ